MQAYSNLFYETRLKAIIDPRWQAQCAANPKLTKRHRLAFQNKLLTVMLSKEPDAIQKEVEVHRQLNYSTNTSSLAVDEEVSVGLEGL